VPGTVCTSSSGWPNPWEDPAVGVREALDRDGFAVLRGVVPVDLCAAVLAAVEEHTGLAVDRPATWDRMLGRRVDVVPVWAHQAQWDIRQLPVLHRAWADAWGRDDLWVSIDSTRFTPPWREGMPEPLALHWEHDPRAPGARMIQGSVALTDCGPGEGGFRCAPSWRDAPARWPDVWPVEPWGVQHRIDPPAADVVEVPVGVGDVVIWESSLPHGTTRNLGSAPRAATYVMYGPAGPPEVAARRIADVEAGRIDEVHRWKPGHDEPQPWPPPVLTDLGERLLGRRPWS
jgi:hypothetical protein